MDPESFYWHDYETTGTDPARDRPVQFAGLRTDPDFNEVGEPLVLYCRPADDTLPHPEACLVTGITPQEAARRGLSERDFIDRIHGELARPGTCGVGYNSIRFDDQVTRFTLYRNLLDPYAREWRNGNSRWDLIDTVRLAYALRPEGIEWPLRDDGTPSFRLEALTAANGIEHAGAHDALADVRATIALARLLRARKPRLLDYVLAHRDKRRVAALLDLEAMTPVVHTSARYPAAQGCTALVAPLARHPVDRNGVVVYDLRHDPRPLLELDEGELARRLFTRQEDLPAGVERLPLKVLHVNRAPVVVPATTLDGAGAERLAIDLGAAARHLERLRAAPDLGERVARLFLPAAREEVERDPETALYGGGFIGDEDRARLERLRALDPAELAGLDPPFDDPRLPELLFRFRARNHPETLTPAERARWRAYRRRRLLDPDGGASLHWDAFRERIAVLGADAELAPAKREVLAQLERWAEQLVATVTAG